MSNLVSSPGHRLRRLLLSAATVIFAICSNAQSKGGVEQYNFFSRTGVGTFMPVAHIESRAGYHAEARYNYEELKTLSLYIGKSFSHTGYLNWTATPMAGVLLGNLKGTSTAVTISLEHQGIFISASPEFVIAHDKAHQNFFYDWTEFGSSIGHHFYAGLTWQQTITRQQSANEWGITMGFKLKSFSFPVYFFDPFQKDRFLILGINWQWDKILN